MATSGELFELLREAFRDARLSFEQVLNSKRYSGRREYNHQSVELFVHRVCLRNCEKFEALERGLGLRFQFSVVKLTGTPEPRVVKAVRDIIYGEVGSVRQAAILVQPYWRERLQNSDRGATGESCVWHILQWLREFKQKGTGYNLAWLEQLFYRAGYQLNVAKATADGNEQMHRAPSTLTQLFDNLRTSAVATTDEAALLKRWERNSWEEAESFIAHHTTRFEQVGKALNTNFAFAAEPSQDEGDTGKFLRDVKVVITRRHTASRVGHLLGMQERGQPYGHSWLNSWVNEVGYSNKYPGRLIWAARVFFALGYRLMIWEESPVNS